MIRKRELGLCAVAALLLPAAQCPAGVQEYFNNDRDAWFDDASAAGVITTIGFNELPNDTIVTEQYAHLGVHFLAFNTTVGEFFEIYPQDGWGLHGHYMVHLEFDDPQIGIAFDFPGLAQVDLYRNDQLVHESAGFGLTGTGQFGGVFDVEFDEAVIVNWGDPGNTFVFLDDLHFVSVPAPAVLPGLFFGMFALRSRRRTPR